jgi:hypothetical protein
MRLRIEQEFALLREAYGEVEHAEAAGEDWFRLPRYPVPTGWCIGETAVDAVPAVFLAKGDYPGSPPYGFLAPAGLNFNGTAPTNTGGPPKPPPFDGEWLHFSWTPENWAATADVRKGSNLLAWCRSFTERFKEGV